MENKKVALNKKFRTLSVNFLINISGKATKKERI